MPKRIDWRIVAMMKNQNATQCVKSVKIINELGMHARAAAKFVKLASQFKSAIYVQKGEHNVNGKSIMGILMLAASMGANIKITAEGADATDAINALSKLIEDGFGEK